MLNSEQFIDRVVLATSVLFFLNAFQVIVKKNIENFRYLRFCTQVHISFVIVAFFNKIVYFRQLLNKSENITLYCDYKHQNNKRFLTKSLKQFQVHLIITCVWKVIHNLKLLNKRDYIKKCTPYNVNIIL